MDVPGAIARCRDDPVMLTELKRIYDQADRAIAALSEEARQGPPPTCLAGGICCKFALFGHRLYLTPAELALLTAQPPSDLEGARKGRCPYQVGGRCTARARRPLGCRTFFCRDEKKFPLRRLHEQFHRRIAVLHQNHCIPYAYAELCGLVLQSFVDK